MEITKAINRLGLPTLLLVIAAILALVAISQPLYTVVEEDFTNGETDVLKFRGTQLRKETYENGRLVEIELQPYGSPAFKEVNMRPVLQRAFAIFIASAVLLLVSASLHLLQQWRPRLGPFAALVLLLGIAAGLGASIYLALGLVGPIRIDIDEAAGFFWGSVPEGDAPLSWSPGAVWYLSMAASLAAVASFVLIVREEGFFRRPTAKA